MDRKPRLRDSARMSNPFIGRGHISEGTILEIGKRIIYLVCTGRKDLGGNDWGDIFAEAIGGEHLASPIGLVDVYKDNIGWSLKTVKADRPADKTSVRLICGRCSPDYSYGITDPHEDIQKTGEAVLSIWNSRVDIAMAHYAPVKECVLIRNNELNEFNIFELYLEHINLAEYEWKENKNGNLEGYSRNSAVKRFIWQPHGAQLTFIEKIPSDNITFRLHHPPTLSMDKTLEAVGFKKEWIEITR